MRYPLTFYALMSHDWTIPFPEEIEISMEDSLQYTFVMTYHNGERSDLIPENVEKLCLEIRKPKSKQC